jgi:ParB-like chromosome segregation protein Spo0J
MPESHELTITTVALDDLVSDPANVRTHDQRNLDAIRGSLARFGQVEPIVVQRGTGRIVGGHGRVEALRALGRTEAAVVEVDVDDTGAAALAIALNRTAELAAWDDEALARMLQSLPDGLAAVAGFTDDEVAGMLNEFSVTPIDAPELADGDRAPIQQMAFVLHDDQVDLVKRALAAAKAAGPFGDTGNENSNGNALARIAEAYLGQG